MLALTDDPKGQGAGGVRVSVEGAVGEGFYPARGLALLMSNKLELIKQVWKDERLMWIGSLSLSLFLTLALSLSLTQVRKDGAREGAVVVDQLQRSIINCRPLSSSLTVRQVGALCSYLAQHAAVDANTIDVTKVVLAGEESVRKTSQLDDAEKEMVMQVGCELLGPLVVRYGSARKACESFCESTGVMRLQGMSALAKDLAELAPQMRVSDKQCACLLRAISLDADKSDAVTPAKFAAFFAAHVAGAASPPTAGAGAAVSAAAASGVDKKLARWNKMKAARRGERDAAAGVARERVLQLEAARLYRSVHRETKIKEVLESSITTEQTVEPSFGEVSYFQYTLCNPFSEERIFGIKFEDPELQVTSRVKLSTGIRKNGY